MAPNIGEVMQQLLRLPRDRRAIVNKTSRGIYSVQIEDEEDYPYVELKINPCSSRYGILSVSKETRGLFPGYREQFVLETNEKPFVMHLTCAEEGTENGSEEGNYLCHPRISEVEDRFLDRVPDAKHRIDGSFKRFYDAHPELIPEQYVKVYRKNSEQFSLEL